MSGNRSPRARNRHRHWLWTFVWAPIAACGSDAERRPALHIDASADTPAAEVGEGGVSALCDFYESLQPSPAELCRDLAVVVSTDLTQGDAELRRERCAQFEKECLDSSAMTRAVVRRQCLDVWFSAECDATVQQIERCFVEEAAASDQWLADLGTCDAPGPAAEGTRLRSPPSCAAAVAACPSFLSVPDDAALPDTDSCEHACAKFADSCDLAACPDSCSSVVLVFGTACEPLGKRFFDCVARSTSFDCSEDSVIDAARACVAERLDYLTCYGLDGPTCSQEPAIDDSCMRQNPARPVGLRCVSDAVPADCELFAGAHHCCATDVAFRSSRAAR